MYIFFSILLSSEAFVRFTKETGMKKMNKIKIFKRKNKLNFGDKYGNKSKSEI